MKVITLRQPWGTIVAENLKDIEVRTWATKLRGHLLIHAGKGWDAAAWEGFKVKIPDVFQQAEFFNQCQEDKGKLIARTNLVDVKRYADPDSFLKDYERHFNPFIRFQLGLVGWVFKRTFRLRNPVEIRGRLGLWNYNGDTSIKGTRSVLRSKVEGEK